jgi:hypothetical protein
MTCGFRGLCGECFSPPPPGIDEREGFFQELCFPCVKLLTKPRKAPKPRTERPANKKYQAWREKYLIQDKGSYPVWRGDSD